MFQENVVLAPMTTFKVGGPAKFLVRVQNIMELSEALDFANNRSLPIFILGGGSNVVISDDGFPGLVITLGMVGNEIIYETDNDVLLRIGSSEAWDDAVWFAIMKGLWGVENLSHIPGNVGAFAVQNVGAYGQEASQVVELVEVFDKLTGDVAAISNSECKFDYRSSIFNKEFKGRYVVLSLTLRLSKKPKPNLSYAELSGFMTKFSLEPTIDNIRHAIITIRDEKFPYPVAAKGGSAGSFFKGPVLSENDFESLVQSVGSKLGKDQADKLLGMKNNLKIPQGYKTPGAFLIDVCGLKGRKVGDAIIHLKQPAIILNDNGNATATDIVELFKATRDVVFEKTGVELMMEPELVGF
jgi:UDP-N-acetylmuramate dehydrogenase